MRSRYYGYQFSFILKVELISITRISHLGRSPLSEKVCRSGLPQVKCISSAELGTAADQTDRALEG